MYPTTRIPMSEDTRMMLEVLIYALPALVLFVLCAFMIRDVNKQLKQVTDVQEKNTAEREAFLKVYKAVEAKYAR